MATLFSVVLVSVLFSISVNAELYKGNACTFAPTGELGVCKPLRSCNSAKESLSAGREPQTCGYEGTIPMVCCTSGSQLPPYPSDHIGEPASTRSKRSTPAEDIEKKCAPMPKKYVKVEKTGQKAWDYCIDLATSVHPCQRAGYSLIKKYSRGNECAHKSTPLVLGGNVTKPGEFPHMAALGDSSDGAIKWVCGGSLISNRWVMTAAHCFSKYTISHVRLGGGDTDSPVSPKTHFEVIERIKHPDYHAPVKYNDIALLKLNRDVPFSKTIRPACLHTGDIVNDGKAVVSGWGSIENGQQSNKLLKTTVERFSIEDCRQANPPIKVKASRGVDDSSQICYGHNEKRQDTCQGDSGGPLMISNKDKVDCTYLVLGITSYGVICGEPGIPAIYTRVSQFVPWIERIVWP